MNEKPLPRAIGEILHEPIGQGAEGRERIFAAFARFAAVATLEKEKDECLTSGEAFVIIL